MYVVHSFYMRVDVCTRVYTRGLMPRVFFAFAHAAHTRVPFKLWVICTVPVDDVAWQLFVPAQSIPTVQFARLFRATKYVPMCHLC